MGLIYSLLLLQKN